jgi:hypothetical protein
MFDERCIETLVIVTAELLGLVAKRVARGHEAQCATTN